MLNLKVTLPIQELWTRDGWADDPPVVVIIPFYCLVQGHLSCWLGSNNLELLGR